MMKKIFSALLMKEITPQKAAAELNWPLETVMAALRSPLVEIYRVIKKENGCKNE